MRCGWRWRWKLRRQRCGITTVGGKISTKYDNITPSSSRERGHRRSRGNAGSLAPIPEVGHTRHASPATLWCLLIKVALCLPLQAHAQRAASVVCCRVWIVPSCSLIIVPLCLESDGVHLSTCRPVDGLLEIDRTFAELRSKSFTQIGTSWPCWVNFFFKVRSGGLFNRFLEFFFFANPLFSLSKSRCVP